jgi:CDP-L-myo-inositol myo-inositolphosphotransferase
VPALTPPGLLVSYVENPAFHLPNGVSLLAASSRLDEPFALLMADHLFTPGRLLAARRRFAETGRSLLVVEPADSFAGNLDDATKVRLHEGRVEDIGKALPAYDAIDTGMFVLDARAVTDALRQAGSEPSISDGMRRLAAAGGLAAFDPQEGWWQDVDDERDLREAEERLIRGLGKETDGILARHVNRRVSLFLTRRLWRLGTHPNLVTAFTLLLGLLAGWAFAQGAGVAWGLVGALLFQLHSILDGTDGELARLLHKESRVGFWFDLVADNLTHVAVFTGLAWGLHADQVPGPWPTVGAAAALGVLLDVLLVAPLLAPGGAMRARRSGLLEKVVDALARRDFTWALFPVVLLGWQGAFLWAVAVGTWAYAVVVAVLRIAGSRAGR